MENLLQPINAEPTFIIDDRAAHFQINDQLIIGIRASPLNPSATPDNNHMEQYIDYLTLRWYYSAQYRITSSSHTYVGIPVEKIIWYPIHHHHFRTDIGSLYSHNTNLAIIIEHLHLQSWFPKWITMLLNEPVVQTNTDNKLPICPQNWHHVIIPILKEIAPYPQILTLLKWTQDDIILTMITIDTHCHEAAYIAREQNRPIAHKIISDSDFRHASKDYLLAFAQQHHLALPPKATKKDIIAVIRTSPSASAEYLGLNGDRCFYHFLNNWDGFPWPLNERAYAAWTNLQQHIRSTYEQK